MPKAGIVKGELSATHMLGIGLDNVYQIELQDISGYVKIARTLRHREQRLEEIIDIVAHGIVAVNQKGLITKFNPAAEKIFKKPKRQLLNAPFYSLLVEFLGHTGHLQTTDKKIILSCLLMKMKARR